MEIVFKKVGELKPYKNNPRNNAGAVDAVAASIKEFGFKVPIVIDADGEIIAGHTRLKAAKKLKLVEVPCIIADDLTPDQIKAFRLADNKTAELAEWDFELLQAELDKIELDMEAFNFEGISGGVLILRKLLRTMRRKLMKKASLYANRETFGSWALIG